MALGSAGSTTSGGSMAGIGGGGISGSYGSVKKPSTYSGYHSDADAAPGLTVQGGIAAPPGTVSGKNMDNLNAIAYQMAYGATPYGMPEGIGLLPSGEGFGYMPADARKGALNDAIAARSILGSWGLSDRVGQLLAKKGIPLAWKIGSAMAMPGLGPAHSLAGALGGFLSKKAFGGIMDKAAERMGESVAYGMASGNWGRLSPSAGLSPLYKGVDKPTYMRLNPNSRATSLNMTQHGNQALTKTGIGNASLNKLYNRGDVSQQVSGAPDNGFLTTYGVITPEIYQKLLDPNMGVPITFDTANPGERSLVTAGQGKQMKGGTLKDLYDLYKSRRDALLNVKDELGLDIKDPDEQLNYSIDSLPGGDAFAKEKEIMSADKTYRDLMNQLGIPLQKSHSPQGQQVLDPWYADKYGWVGHKPGDVSGVQPVYIKDKNGYTLNPAYKNRVTNIILKDLEPQEETQRARPGSMGKSVKVPTYSRRQARAINPMGTRTKLK